MKIKIFRRGEHKWLRIPRPIATGLEAGQEVEITRVGDKIYIETEPDERAAATNDPAGY